MCQVFPTRKSCHAGPTKSGSDVLDYRRPKIIFCTSLSFKIALVVALLAVVNVVAIVGVVAIVVKVAALLSVVIGAYFKALAL